MAGLDQAWPFVWRRLAASFISVTVLLALGSLPVRAQDHVVRAAVFEDVSGALELEAAAQRAFTPWTQRLLLEHIASSYWVRLEIESSPPGPGAVTPPQAARSGPQQLVLFIEPPYLGEVTLHDPRRQEASPARAGMGQSQEDAEFPTSKLSFLVTVHAGEPPRTVWLQIKPLRRVFVEVHAVPLHAALLSEQHRLTRRLISHGFQFICLGLGLYLWWRERDALMGLFVARQTLMIGMFLVSDGLLRVPTWDNGPSVPALVCFGLMFSLAVNALFQRAFMGLFPIPRAALRLWWGPFALFPVALVLVIGGRVDLAQKVNEIGIAATPMLFFGLYVFAVIASRLRKAGKAGQARNDAELPLQWLLPLVLTAIGLHMLWSLHFMGLATQGAFLAGGAMVQVSTNAALISVVLLIRAQRKRRARTEVITQLRLAEEQERLERDRRRESTEFLAMLTHELKTPLSIIRIALCTPELTTTSRVRAERAVMDMSKVIDRCAQVDLLQEDEPAPARLDACLVDLVHDIVANCGQPDSVDLQVDDDAPNREVDARLLGTIVANLLDNALKYRAPHSQVLIRVASLALDERPGVAVCVRNLPGASGWPEPDRVFKKYYRSNGARRFTGSGLGLHLAERLAQRLGGELRYAPDATRVQFALWLPA